MRLTKVWDYNAQAHVDGYRIIANQGGTSSSKTYSLLQLMLIIAGKYSHKLISVVSESLPHLKRGALRDFIQILKDEDLYRESLHNKTDNSFKVHNSVIEFFGADSPDKLRGARRDYLFINECNNIPYDSFQQLEVRTKERIFLDYNPTSEFWVHEKLLGHEDVKYIQSTYLDNDYLDPNIVKSIERRKDQDENWWRVFGLGEVGSTEGIVYTNWKIVNKWPECRWEVLGIDFGYTNDPTAIVRIGYYDQELYIDEVVYETGLTNQDIGRKLKGERVQMYADSAEPKSIEEIRRMGFHIKPCEKGKDSILNGITKVKEYKLNITKTSTNVIKELRNYQWRLKDGRPDNKPIDNYNHALDAMRYAITMKVKARNKVKAFA